MSEASDLKYKGARRKLAPQDPPVELAQGGHVAGPSPMVHDERETLFSGASVGLQAPAVENARPACLKPEPNVLVKLGSLAVHAEEMLEPGGHELDVAAIRGLLDDPELRAWLEAMGELALLPVKR